MKKQGIPEPLDETLVTRKRKDAPPAIEQERKKRSRIAAREAKAKSCTSKETCDSQWSQDKNRWKAGEEVRSAALG